jgi:hypothetical protein
MGKDRSKEFVTKYDDKVIPTLVNCYNFPNTQHLVINEEMLDKGFKVENIYLFGTISLQLEFKTEPNYYRMSYFDHFRIEVLDLLKPKKKDLITKNRLKVDFYNEILMVCFYFC